MKLTEELYEHITNINTVGQAVTLLRAYAEGDEKLKKVIDRVTYGVKKRFHYNYAEKGKNFVEKEKHGYVIINGQEMSYDDYWDEMDARKALAVDTLITHLQDPDAIHPR